MYAAGRFFLKRLWGVGFRNESLGSRGLGIKVMLRVRGVGGFRVRVSRLVEG